MLKIVFIDRDGVINVDPIGDYVKSWAEFKFEKGALKALKTLTDRGFEIVVISNQAGIGDGVYTESSLRDIHKRMLKTFTQHGIRIRSAHYCLHGKTAGCKCRKPETGLFEDAVKGIEYDPGSTYFIGDKSSDVAAGKRFGIRTLFVRTGHGKTEEAKLEGDLKPDLIAENIEEAVEKLPS